MECAWDGGESMENLAEGWSSGASRELQQASTAIRSGDPKLMAYAREKFGTTVMNRAEQMVYAVEHAEKVGVMYRGMGVSKTEATRLLALKGKEFGLPLSSFTTKSAVASEFASIRVAESAQGGVGVFIEVRGARGLDISSFAIERYKYQAEHIVLGDFRVVEASLVGPQGKTVRLVLEPM